MSLSPHFPGLFMPQIMCRKPRFYATESPTSFLPEIFLCGPTMPFKLIYADWDAGHRHIPSLSRIFIPLIPKCMFLPIFLAFYRGPSKRLISPRIHVQTQNGIPTALKSGLHIIYTLACFAPQISRFSTHPDTSRESAFSPKNVLYL